MRESIAITTFDNPYSPFERFDKWYNFDSIKGYNTCSKLARVKDALSTANSIATDEESIDAIIDTDPLTIYRKVTPSDYDDNGIAINNADVESISDYIKEGERPRNENW